MGRFQLPPHTEKIYLPVNLCIYCSATDALSEESPARRQRWASYHVG